jgi:molybdenum cofactor synthesis domain-containing protein
MIPTLARTAAALLIGNELLSGKTQEKNLFPLAATLRARGIRLCRAVVVGDDQDEIATEVRRLSKEYDLLFTSGGVGPTHDDVTLEAVAKAFGVTAKVHPTLEQSLRNTYGSSFTVDHLRMALVPEGAELIVTQEVTWPTVVMRNVWILPGIPEIFRTKLGVVHANVRGASEFVTRAIYTKLDEGDLTSLLNQIVEAHPSVEVGSYPKWFDPRYKTKVTFDGDSQSKVDLAVEEFLRLLPSGGAQTLDPGDD